MCNQSQAIAVLEEVYISCNPIFSNAIEDAYLYGSYAWGDYHAESDIDILLTVDMEAEEISRLRRQLSHIVSELCLKHDVTVSVTVKPISQFRKYADILPYYQNILREGIRYVS